MSSILYYSKHCNHSSKILTLLSRMNEIKKEIQEIKQEIQEIKNNKFNK